MNLNHVFETTKAKRKTFKPGVKLNHVFRTAEHSKRLSSEG
jgi:hypothetical protein